VTVSVTGTLCRLGIRAKTAHYQQLFEILSIYHPVSHYAMLSDLFYPENFFRHKVLKGSNPF
jgi:hypothetical protein